MIDKMDIDSLLCESCNSVTVSYKPQVMSVTDYYSFGSEIAERSYSQSTPYRFSFNGKEDIHEQRFMQDYGARWYNKALGRFISADPLIVSQKKYPWLSSYQFAGNKPIVAIDVDGKEDIWTHVTEFANGSRTEIQVFKGDDNYAAQRRYLAEQLGIDMSKLPEHGSIVSSVKYNEQGGKSVMGYYMPSVEVSYNKWDGLANEAGRYLEGSKLDKLNSGFVRKYYGSAGQERFLGELERASTYVKLFGVLSSGIGALTGQPEVVAAGAEMYELGERMDEVGLGIKAAKYLSNGNMKDFALEGTLYVGGRTLDKASDIIQPNNDANKLMFRYSKDKLLEQYKENIQSGTNKENK